MTESWSYIQRLWRGSLKTKPTFSVFKDITPKSLNITPTFCHYYNNKGKTLRDRKEKTLITVPSSSNKARENNKAIIIYPSRPINIVTASNNTHDLRLYNHKHLRQWIQIEDPAGILNDYTNPETESFPAFKDGFYNIKHILDREE